MLPIDFYPCDDCPCRVPNEFNPSSCDLVCSCNDFATYMDWIKDKE